MTLHVGVIIQIAISPDQLESILEEQRIRIMESNQDLKFYKEQKISVHQSKDPLQEVNMVLLFICL